MKKNTTKKSKNIIKKAKPKTTKKSTKKVVKKTTKKATTKKASTKKSTKKATTKTKKTVSKKPTKKISVKTASKKAKKVVKNVIKKAEKIVKDIEAVKPKIDPNDVIILESGEILTKEEFKQKKKKEKEEIKEMKKGKKVEKPVDESDGYFTETGKWNGSTMDDATIEKIENPEEKKLVQKLDELQEEIRRMRENNEDPIDISNAVIEASNLRHELEKLRDNL